jgi:Ca-activated chloride channel homolog
MLTWTAPSALWLLILVPLVWAAHAFTRTTFNTRQRAAQALVRSLLLVVIVVAVARPILSTSSPRQSIVYLVDVSHSISGHAIDSAAARIEDLDRAVHPTQSRIVVFGRTAARVEDVAALRRFADVEATGGSAAIDRSGTDIEGALAAARAELAPDSTPRIVLFTDGHETEGEARRALLRLGRSGVPVSIEPMAVRSIADIWVNAIDVPDRIPAGAMFVAQVSVGAQRRGSATVELRTGGKTIGRQQVTLLPGPTVVPIEVKLDSPGTQVLQAAVATPGDPLVANNMLERAVIAETRARVLYIEGTPASAHYLAAALTAAGFDVTVKPPSALPATAAAFEPWDVVIISDVARSAIRDAGMNALADWVEHKGGGLLIAGGESVYGEGGYQKTALERVSPVTYERRDEPDVALVLVLDRSWSMAGSSIDLCKAAAQAAVDVLTDKQAVGVITFNDQYEWNVALGTVGANRARIREQIGAITPSGPTRIYPALEQAYLSLKNTRARAKHVVLLSDGRSLPDDHESLVRRMTGSHITVSSIAVGPAADRELLHNIAVWGKGRDYAVQNARELPEVFVKEAKNAATPSFDEKEIVPVVKAPAFLANVDVAKIPHLKGMTATVIKDPALEVLATDEGDPLLAFWPVGLGRTAVFASDVKDRWGAPWIKWRGYGPFFASVVRSVQRQRVSPVDLSIAAGPIRSGTRSIAITLEARDERGGYRNLLRPSVIVKTDARSTTVPLRQVAPGRYQASVLADAAQTATVSATDATGGSITRIIVPDPAAEYRFQPVDDDALREIAASTGGTLRPRAEALAASPGERHSKRRPLWPALTMAALALWFVDILLRRVRIFEPRVTSVSPSKDTVLQRTA